ncbi:MAG: SRPBCC family protein [Minicystis sp.]
MLTASVLLLIIALLGAFDIAYFHWHRCGLARRAESRTEVWIHVARGVNYALQMALVPSVRFAGAWYLAFVALFVADVAIAIGDVVVEPASRKSQGGLPGGEYLMHIVLSVLVGAYLHALAGSTHAWMDLPTAITWAPAAPLALRAALLVMAACCLGVAVFEALALLFPEDARPRPLHVSVRLRAGIAELWDVTQDHVLHPRWDHRFSRIEMLADRVETGTEMRYERTVLGLTIRGFGRYKLHRPCKQSTFEFWSDHPLSLIRRGVGLWLYRPQDDGTVEFSTSYTYEVRWGVLGRALDRLLFRPFFQAETERSFRRLAAMFFPEGASRVYGAAGRKPVRAAAATAQGWDIVATA